MLIRIGAKVVRHGRYVTFQLAEVAVPRDLFRKFLRLINGCGQPRCLHDGGPSRCIKATRQDRSLLRSSECALTVRNGHRTEIFIAKSYQRPLRMSVVCSLKRRARVSARLAYLAKTQARS